MLMIRNKEKKGWHYLAIKKTVYIIKMNKNQIIMGTFIA